MLTLLSSVDGEQQTFYKHMIATTTNYNTLK